MIVAAVQTASSHNLQENIQKACQFIQQAAKQGAKLVVLPENFATLGLPREQALKNAETYQTGPLQQQLAEAAKANQVWVIGGTLPIKASHPGKIFSSCIVWNDHGESVARYDKTHLFDVNVTANQAYRESEILMAGNKIVVVPTPFGKIGLAICYDIRFPELFRAFMLQGAQIIVLPSAFTVETGTVHWETLLKARAIENLCYLIGAAEVGTRADGRTTYGHSMIVGPWGEILAHQDSGTGVILANIDLVKLKALREQFPVLSHYQSFVMQALARGNR